MANGTEPDTPSSAIRVGFQGLFGSYSHAAARQFYQGNTVPAAVQAHAISGNGPAVVKLVPGPDIDSLLAAVETGMLTAAFIPAENSVSGSFPLVYDLLVRRNVAITAEGVVPESYHLLGPSGLPLEDITEVRSHPAVLEHCREYLDQLSQRRKALGKPALVLSQETDTALSAKYIHDHLPTTSSMATIGTKEAAELYGLAVLEENIEDGNNVVTRYFEISLRANVPGRFSNPKTSVSFTLKNASSTLFKALSCFALRDLNISKIESRPHGSALYPWELTFFLTVEGSLNEEPMKRALMNLEEYVSSFKVLGCYASKSLPASSSSNGSPYATSHTRLVMGT